MKKCKVCGGPMYDKNRGDICSAKCVNKEGSVVNGS